tara:strand:+ start:165 stop:1223 length:1059 start_codon:yes stop_codon:yes gene_type:complete
MNNTNSNVVRISQRNSRTRVCPVRDKRVTEYAFHHSEVHRLIQKSQARIEDSKVNDVATLAEQLETDGQDQGGCVLDEGDRLLVLWGCTRHRAAERLDKDGKNIKNLARGYLWMSLYEEDVALIPEFQAIENNIHKFAKSATIDDNVQSLENMITNGLLDAADGTKFAYLSDVQQKKQVMDAARRTHMPTSKHRTLWRKLRQRNRAIQQQMASWEKHQIATYFGSNNDYGFTSEDLEGFTQSCAWILEDDSGKKTGVYFILNATSLQATLAQCHKKRNIANKVDEIVIIASLNGVNSQGIIQAREKVIAAIKEWNPTVKANYVVDRIMFVPQTAAEQQSQLIAGKYIKDTKF